MREVWDTSSSDQKGGGTLGVVWNMKEKRDVQKRCGYAGEKGHLGEVWICRRRWNIVRGVRKWLIVRGVEFSGGSGTWQEVLEVWYMQEEVGHCKRCGVCWGRLQEVWNMLEEVRHCGRCGIEKGGEHCERCGICRSRWEIKRHIEYTGGDGTLPEIGICWRRWDIVSVVEYAGGGGTLRSVWNRQGRRAL